MTTMDTNKAGDIVDTILKMDLTGLTPHDRTELVQRVRVVGECYCLDEEEERSLKYLLHYGLLVPSVRAGALNVIKYLVEECGANFERSGGFALRESMELGHLHIVTYLVEKGARVYQCNESWENLYTLGRIDVLHLMFEYGVTPYQFHSALVGFVPRNFQAAYSDWLEYKSTVLESLDRACTMYYGVRDVIKDVEQFLFRSPFPINLTL